MVMSPAPQSFLGSLLQVVMNNLFPQQSLTTLKELGPMMSSLIPVAMDFLLIAMLLLSQGKKLSNTGLFSHSPQQKMVNTR